MAIQPNIPSDQPFTRLQHPDPITNQIVQDIYNKLNQLQALILKLHP